MLDPILTALRGGDFAAAAAAARSVLALQPDSAQAHHLLGLALRQQGDLAAADAAFDRALVLAPEQAAFHLSRGLLAAQRQDLDTARAALSEALKHDPNQLMAYVTLAELALSAQQLDAADQQLKLAERIASEHPHVLVLRSQWQSASGQGEAALRTLQHAVERRPDDALVVGALGLALLNRRHYAFAEQSLRKAVALQPRAQELRYALLHALIAQQRFDEATEEVDALLAIDAEAPRALTLKGQITLDRGEPEAAIAALSRSLQLDPAQPHALDALVRGYRQRGDAEGARAAFEALLATHPREELLWSALVDLWRGDAAPAAAVAQRWCQTCPDSARAHEIAALASEAAQLLDAAQSHAQSAVQRDPRRIGAHLVLARAELRAGQPEAVRARLAPIYAAQAEPAIRVLLADWLGRACDASGAYADAVTHWTQMHAGAPRARDLPVAATATIERREDAPALLWGPPGSGVDRLAAALSNNAPEAGLHWVPQLEAGLSGSRLVAVLDDPRAMLLSWLASGSPQGWTAADPLAAAALLAQELAAFETLRSRGEVPILVLRAADLAAAPERVAADVSAFLTLPTPLALPPAPTAFPSGHANRYAEALREPFARLA